MWKTFAATACSNNEFCCFLEGATLLRKCRISEHELYAGHAEHLGERQHKQCSGRSGVVTCLSTRHANKPTIAVAYEMPPVWCEIIFMTQRLWQRWRCLRLLFGWQTAYTLINLHDCKCRPFELALVGKYLHCCSKEHCGRRGCSKGSTTGNVVRNARRNAQKKANVAAILWAFFFLQDSAMRAHSRRNSERGNKID